MASIYAMGVAAQCWCDPRVKDQVMDPNLANVFAETLDKLLSNPEEYVKARIIELINKVQNVQEQGGLVTFLGNIYEGDVILDNQNFIMIGGGKYPLSIEVVDKFKFYQEIE